MVAKTLVAALSVLPAMFAESPSIFIGGLPSQAGRQIVSITCRGVGESVFTPTVDPIMDFATTIDDARASLEALWDLGGNRWLRRTYRLVEPNDNDREYFGVVNNDSIVSCDIFVTLHVTASNVGSNRGFTHQCPPMTAMEVRLLQKAPYPSWVKPSYPVVRSGTPIQNVGDNCLAGFDHPVCPGFNQLIVSVDDGIEYITNTSIVCANPDSTRCKGTCYNETVGPAPDSTCHSGEEYCIIGDGAVVIPTTKRPSVPPTLSPREQVTVSPTLVSQPGNVPTENPTPPQETGVAQPTAKPAPMAQTPTMLSVGGTFVEQATSTESPVSSDSNSTEDPATAPWEAVGAISGVVAALAAIGAMVGIKARKRAPSNAGQAPRELEMQQYY